MSESGSGSCEIDAWTFLNSLTGDVISRTAFGSNYEEGKRIFQLLTEQGRLTVQVLRSIYIPGWRFGFKAYQWTLLINVSTKPVF